MSKGLYEKYTVINNKTGKQIKDMVFVLRPDRDVVALKALETYVEYTGNIFLKEDLRDLIKHCQALKGDNEEFKENDWVVNVSGAVFELSEFQISNLGKIKNLVNIRHATAQEKVEEKNRRVSNNIDQILLDLSDDERDGLYKKLEWGDY